ncbi:MAG TPA: methylmalonyl Co-A mutase-associated GTPase MeaB, partial [Mucilaginibacter sp.]
IADAFIVNKADRDGADIFANNLKKISAQDKHPQVEVFKTVASTGEGVPAVANFIRLLPGQKNNRRQLLMAEKAFRLIQQKLTRHIDKAKLRHDVAEALNNSAFNLYQFVDSYKAG